MATAIRRTIIVLIGLVLVAVPTLVRDNLWQYNVRSYVAPNIPDLAMAATPVPTAVPIPQAEVRFTANRELRAGPVVLDLAHYNSINPSSLQPLADALAEHGVGLRYWLSNVDVMSVVNYLDYPDQSEALAAELDDASALIIISPFFLWSTKEIALVEEFVADGGRLLLISDPDILGDYAAATNMIGEPFGVVFNEDYLYDTTTNDGNYTFFFQQADAPTQEVTDEGAIDGENSGDVAHSYPSLAAATIAFYGGRSLSGDLQPVLHSIDTTLSSLRVGRNHFTTVGIAGIPQRGTAGRVLALSDLDVLTEPYRQRHDNQQLVEYVASFLSADQRVKRVVDFPDYLGKQVALAFGASAAINADLIMQGAQIQHALEESGRTLTLHDSSPLTGTQSAASSADDLIYLAAYTTAISQTTLLDDLGIEFYREVVTETVEITPEPTRRASADATATRTAPEAGTTVTPGRDDTDSRGVLPAVTPTPPLTPTRPITATAALTAVTPLTTTPGVTASATITGAEEVEPMHRPVTTTVENSDETGAVTATVPLSSTAEATPTFEIRTIITTYLQLDSGLTFVADQTVLIVHTQRDSGQDVLAVLAANNRGIDTGVNRLLKNDFSGCVIGNVLTFCALEAESSSTVGKGSSGGSGKSTDNGTENGSTSGDNGTPTPPQRSTNATVLLIDDNRAATEGELSEADLFLQLLIAGGHKVDLWSVTDQGAPSVTDLSAYGWVIWSNGGYAEGAISAEDLDTVFSYINLNGRITISSRMPLPGLEEVTPLRDLVVESTIAELVTGLPETPIDLSDDADDAAVLNAMAEQDEATQVVLRRGPGSDNADAPALVVLAAPSDAESEARLMIIALSMTWLPDEIQATLINNMASWMLN